VTNPVLVIGGGIAGGTAALLLTDRGIPVVLLKEPPETEEGSSYLAQGGIVYRNPEDSPETLMKDIWEAGARCGDIPALRILTREGPGVVERVLIRRLEVPFDRTAEGELCLTREGGHRCPRIIHVRDATGKAVMEKLDRALGESSLVHTITGGTAVDLLTEASPGGKDKICRGARIITAEGDRLDISASHTIMATGGAGALYPRSSNPSQCRGEGIAMAHRAGALIEDMEYVQFHPTVLALEGAPPLLITEAARGAGARLVNRDNRPFMNRYAPGWGDLAPRDLVSRSLFQEMRNQKCTSVFLNFRDYIPPETIRSRFPTIYRRCLDLGTDITVDLLPVSPAAHFTLGGIKVDTWGCSSLPGLYALGECSRTGVHGANRLASTSLLEALVWAERTAGFLSRRIPSTRLSPTGAASFSDIFPPPARPSWVTENSREDPNPALNGVGRKLEGIMESCLGVERRTGDVKKALEEIEILEKEVIYLTGRFPAHREGARMRNGLGAARLIARGALNNRVSRGTHFIVCFEEEKPMIHAEERRKKLISILTGATAAVTGTELARQTGVSRQVVVQDMAVLRAAGVEVEAGPQGYRILTNRLWPSLTVAVKHGPEETEEELNLLVDAGVEVLDVTVEHRLYGEIRGALHIAGRDDVRKFMNQLGDNPSGLLLELTGGIHLHTITARSRDRLDRALENLRNRGFLVE